MKTERRKHWLVAEHPCGCRIEWGAWIGNPPEILREFVDVASRYPCPMHGSATCDPAERLREGEERFLVANNVYYRNWRPGPEA